MSRLREFAFVSWTALALGLGGSPARATDAGMVRSGERFLVLSRHSGEVLVGEDFPIHALGASGARALADLVRIETAAGRSPPWSAADLVARVDEDRVIVGELRAMVPPRGRADSAVEVQVFGLVGSDRVSVRCTGRGVRVRGEQIEDLPSGWQTLRDALGTGTIVCGGGPWEARVDDGAPRPYSGTFSFRPLPDRPPEPGTTRREARARRGSEVIFHTTLASYVSGVLAAEQAGLTGEPAVALAEVIAHDARVHRHRGRPLCDTTHCQAFLGTTEPTTEVSRALELPDLPTDRWLPYFRGGVEAWEVRRPTAELRAALGDVQRLTGDGRTVEVSRAAGVEHVPCERVRAALRLQGCPTEGVVEGETVRLRGRGRGHGLGLDVEAARRSGLP
ncbi:MAG TPA: SpoIID/LytB domain-containing protein, partial [Myxococcaceae bacterium]